jgi:hypothetical protein
MKPEIRNPRDCRALFLAATAALTLFAGAARAETEVFRDVLRPHGVERGSAERLADGRTCGLTTDKTFVNVPVFEKCMRTHGWVYDHAQVDASDPPGVYYDDMWQRPNGSRRGDAEREAVYKACDPAGARDPASAGMKGCMLSKGWRFAFSKPDPAASAPAAASSGDGKTIWKDAGGRNRNDDVLGADAASCQRSLGPGAVLRPPGPEYQSCMRARGWRFVSSSGPSYWKDPNHDGMMCHDIMGGAGSSCSNF